MPLPPPSDVTLDPVGDVGRPFEAVVREFGRKVLRMCRTIVGVDEADDAWSETFLSAMKAYPALPSDANVEAWLITIAQRKAIDIIRTRRRIAIPMSEVPDRPSSFGVPGRDHHLVESLKLLPTRQRQAVAYRYLAGLPYALIADIIGGTTESARRAAADGIKALRRRLVHTNPEGAAERLRHQV